MTALSEVNKETNSNNSYFDILPESLKQCLNSQGIENPTSVQDQTLSPILEGQDVLAQSQTGSGKTLAFTIPVGMNLTGPEGRTPRVLVLTPTRELATQVESVFFTTLKSFRLRCTVVIGGASYHQQRKVLGRGVDIVVGTPGRIVDLIKQDILKLDGIETFVLDEVDQMLDIGFADELAEIQKALPSDIQTLFFSATLGYRVEKLAKSFLKDPYVVKIANNVHSPQTIEHGYIQVKEGRELQALVNALLHYNPSQAIVFCETKKECMEVSGALSQRGFNVGTLNSDISQDGRQYTMNRFKKGDLQYLVATNVAARGIDVQALPLVINYSMPYDSESYVHRSGRTGRAGEDGRAWTLITPKNFHRYRAKMRELNLRPDIIEIPSRRDILKKVAEREIVSFSDNESENLTLEEKIALDVLEDLPHDEVLSILKGLLSRRLSDIDVFDSARIIADKSDFYRKSRGRNYSRRGNYGGKHQHGRRRRGSYSRDRNRGGGGRNGGGSSRRGYSS
mgnify:CR=1 FL=1